MFHLARRNLPALGVAAAAVALAAVSPGLASSGSPERGASDAKATLIQNKATFKELPAALDDFDTCAFTTVLTHVVKAPKAGYLQVTGIVSAARDVGTRTTPCSVPTSPSTARRPRRSARPC